MQSVQRILACALCFVGENRAGADGTAGTVWPYHFLVALPLVGVGYTVRGGSGAHVVALN